MLILAFGKNGTVGVIRSWGAIRVVHMTACPCVSPPLPSPRKTMPATACHSLSLFYFSSQAVFMPLSSCFSSFSFASPWKNIKTFFSISSMVKKKSTATLAALRGCTQAQQCFERNGNISMLTMPMLLLKKFTIWGWWESHWLSRYLVRNLSIEIFDVMMPQDEKSNFMAIYLVTGKPQKSASWWRYMKSQGIIKVVSLYPLGTTNVCTKCHGNPSDGCWNISGMRFVGALQWP